MVGFSDAVDAINYGCGGFDDVGVIVDTVVVVMVITTVLRNATGFGRVLVGMRWVVCALRLR